MNAKQLKFLELFASMCKSENLAEATVLSKCLTAFLELDYALATDAWDYLATTKEVQLASDEKCALAYGQTAFEIFFAKASTKCVKAINDVASIRKAVYMYNPQAATGDSFNIIVDLLATNKITESDEIFKCLLKNTTIHYGKTLKTILERVFIEILKKSPTKKIEMSKKLSTLLLGFISKIKTEEKSMLEQRIRETM